MGQKQINFYVCGDSNDVKTWSNVPYLFSLELEKRGFSLNRIDIQPHPWINKTYNRISFLIFQRIFKRNACPVFARSWMHRILIRRKMKQAAKKYDGQACLNLFLSYAFRNEFSVHPSVLWCDWSDAIVIERIGRRVKSYERKWLRHETSVIKNADAVYSMFPFCSRKMTEMYGREVRYLDRNVVNTLFNGSIDMPDLVSRHATSDKILFIGNHRYKSGLKSLIDAVSILRAQHHNLAVDVIGMTDKIFGDVPDWVKFHGYLDKTNITDCENYYNLIFGARLLVNPTAGWAGYSSVIEAMYYGTPVVISAFDDFVEEFGTDILFGAYSTSVEDLPSKILSVAFAENYERQCINAHEAVQDYTWSNYIDAFFKDLASLHIL